MHFLLGLAVMAAGSVLGVQLGHQKLAHMAQQSIWPSMRQVDRRVLLLLLSHAEAAQRMLKPEQALELDAPLPPTLQRFHESGGLAKQIRTLRLD
jgi:hypothetical protein